MDYFELECAVEAWAKEKGILEKGTPMAQSIKTLEEALELSSAIDKGNKQEIIDAIGDVTVTLIIQCKMQGVSLEYCLEHAYNQIKNRKGTMMNGKFVKEE